MTADPPKSYSALEEAYVAATDRARQTVAAAFDLEEVDVAVLPFAAQYRAVWRVRLDLGAPVPTLLIAIPWTFPDELPDIFVPEDALSSGIRIPHLDKSRQLCTFDDTTRFPNPDRAGDAVCNVIARAVRLIQDGVAGINSAEFLDEFEAHWVDTARTAEFSLGDIRPDPPHRRIISMRFTPALGRYSVLFAEDSSAATVFLQAIGRGADDRRSTLYLHLDGIERFPDLATNADVYRLLEGLPEAREVLLGFLRNVDRPARVLFSVPVRDRRVFGAWVHERYGTTVRKSDKNRRVMDEAPGFRKGHLPPNLELRLFGSQAAGRFVVRRVDAPRLLGRTAGGNDSAVGRVNVVGCGSVGGFVADTIRYAHPHRLMLADPKVLDVHNVPRHLCDMTFVGTNKAYAVRTKLQRHDPHLRVDADGRDALEILRVEERALAPADLTIVAVAAVAVERRVNALARGLNLGTVAYTWIEPYAIAGHAIIVPPAGRGCFECLLDEEHRINVRVLENPEQFELVDAGCRGSYVPYSGVDVQVYARTIARILILRARVPDAVVVTWIGDIERARREGWKIRDEWQDALPFSLHVLPIPLQPGCSVCGKWE